jgi:hypothetical protein
VADLHVLDTTSARDILLNSLKATLETFEDARAKITLPKSFERFYQSLLAVVTALENIVAAGPKRIKEPIQLANSFIDQFGPPDNVDRACLFLG